MRASGGSAPLVRFGAPLAIADMSAFGTFLPDDERQVSSVFLGTSTMDMKAPLPVRYAISAMLTRSLASTTSNVVVCVASDDIVNGNGDSYASALPNHALPIFRLPSSSRECLRSLIEPPGLLSFT